MSIDTNIGMAAKRLRDAKLSGVACEPIRELIGNTDLVKAYAVQEINTAIRLKEGRKIVGRKIGLTAPVVQKQLGVNQPDFGMLWDDTEIQNGGEISMKELMQPKVEAEIAFVLGKDLTSETLTSVDIISSVEYALASIEIVGSRIKNWDIKITDTIADNASASHWLIGHTPVKLDSFDILNCKMTIKQNNKVVSEGIGKACLGSPVNAMLWLARKMQAIGKPMREGDLILTGALGPMIVANEGDDFKVVIEGLGEAGLSFVK